MPRKSRRFVHRVLPDLSAFEPPPFLVVPLLTCDQLFTTLRGHRCEIITLLAFAGCLCVGEIARRLQLGAPTISRELRCLLHRGIVRYDQDLTAHRFVLRAPFHWLLNGSRVQFGMQLPNGDWLMMQRSSILDGRRARDPDEAHEVAVPASASKSVLEDDSPFQLRHSGRARTTMRLKSCDQVLHAFSGHRYEMMTLLALEGQLRSGQLAKRLHLSPQVISRELGDLRAAALVDRSGSSKPMFYHLANSVDCRVNAGCVRLGVDLPSGDWMLLHREEFSDAASASPMPTEWIER